MSDKLKQRRLTRSRRSEGADNVPLDAAPTPAQQRILDHIAEVSRNARAAWFTLNALLLFCGVTLLGVQDKDFFEYGASTQLPLINVSVPTKAFFWTAPVLVTAFYTYLHVYLDKLWRNLTPQKLGPVISGRDLDDVVYPWLLADAAISLRTDTKQRDWFFHALTVWSAFGLAWLFGPMVMYFFWSKSFAPHDEMLTLSIGLLWVFTIVVGCYSLYRLPVRMPRAGRWAGWLFAAGMAVMISFLGYGATERNLLDREAPDSMLYQANLYRAELTVRPSGWQSTDSAWRDFERARRSVIEAETGGDPKLGGEVTSRLEKEFDEQRVELLVTLDRGDWRGADLRSADLRFAYLVGSDFRYAKLDGAQLYAANLERSALVNAELNRASLRSAEAQGASFMWAQLEDADLVSADLKGAEFGFAKLNRAKLMEARLERGTLRGAQLVKANLSQAQLRDANFAEANLEGANLRNVRAEGAGFESANLAGATLSHAHLDGARFPSASLEGVLMLSAHADGADFSRVRMMRADLSGTRLRKTNFEGADLTGANLRGTRLGGADFTRARLDDVNFDSAEIADLKIAHMSAIGADFSRTQGMSQSDFDTTFGDGSTLLPRDVVKPPHWPEDTIPRAERYERWRAWAISTGLSARWFPESEDHFPLR